MEQKLHSSHTPYPSMAPLFDLFAGPPKMAVLEAAIELGIAEILVNHSGVDTISEQIGPATNNIGLVAFLDAMVAMGLAKKKNKQYSNTDFSRHFLHHESPVFMGGLVKSMKAMQHKNLADIANIVKNGPPEVPKDQILNSEVKWEQAVNHLAAYQRAGMGAICADLMETLPEFKGLTKILDLGGGPGLIGAEILKRLPGAKGVLVDLPAIIKRAKAEIIKEGMAERISFLPGDYNDIDLGNGYDLIWASHNLYYVKDRVSFFKRLKKALTSQGVLVCLHEGLTHERTAPDEIVLSRLSLALEGQDVSFTQGEIAACIEQAGFEQIETRTLILPSGISELVVARPGKGLKT